MGRRNDLPATFTFSEGIASGLTKHRLYAMRDMGLIEPLARGLYRQTTKHEPINLDYLEIALRAPRATLCLVSALAQHGLTDAIPASIDIALPRGSHRPAIDTPVSWHQFDRTTFNVGRDTMPVTRETSIGIYNPERAIIDAFRLRHQEGPDLAFGALRRWLRRPGSSPRALHELAERHFPRTAGIILHGLEILQYE